MALAPNVNFWALAELQEATDYLKRDKRERAKKQEAKDRAKVKVVVMRTMEEWSNLRLINHLINGTSGAKAIVNEINFRLDEG